MKDRKGQFLQVFLNDRPLYDKWQADDCNWISVSLPKVFIADSNTLVIQNNAGNDWAIDCVAIRRPVRGNVWVGLSDSEWLDKKHTRYLPQMVLGFHAGVPSLSEEEWKELSELPQASILSITERQRLFASYKRRIQILSSPRYEKHFPNWKERIGNAVMRGADVICRVRIGPQERPGYVPLILHFAPFVTTWILDFERPDDIDGIVDFLHARLLEDSVVIRHEGMALSHETMRATPLLFIPGGYGSQRINGVRNTLCRSGICSYDSLHPVAWSLSIGGPRDIKEQARISWNLARQVVSWLHQSDRFVLDGGRVGGGLFPKNADSPSDIWTVVRALTPIGAGSGKRTPCNVVPYDSNYGLIDTNWVAAQNSPDQVTMLVQADGDRKRQVGVQCVVPWKEGKTTVEIQPIKLSPQDLPEVGEAAVVKTTVSNGLVEFLVDLDSLLHIRICKDGASPLKQQIVESHSEARIKTERNWNLLRLSTTRLPKALWTESAMVYSAPRHFDPMTAGVEAQVVVATPGKVFSEEQAVPWSGKSLKVDFSQGTEHLPKARIYLDLLNYKQAQYVDFWVFPRAERDSITMIAGTPKCEGDIRLRANRWNKVRLSLKPIFKNRRIGDFHLYISPSTADLRQGPVSFEFNSFLAVGSKIGDQTVSKEGEIVEVKADAGSTQLVLIGPIGQPVVASKRLSGKLLAKQAWTPEKELQLHISKEAKILQARIRSMTATQLTDALMKQLPTRERDLVKRGVLGAIPITLKLGEDM